jgi:hypothetical protein
MHANGEISRVRVAPTALLEKLVRRSQNEQSLALSMPHIDQNQSILVP